MNKNRQIVIKLSKANRQKIDVAHLLLCGVKTRMKIASTNKEKRRIVS